jgi:hypothetical protein
MIQGKIFKIDFDLYTYGPGCYARLRHNYQDRDFEKWIQGVSLRRRSEIPAILI